MQFVDPLYLEKCVFYFKILIFQLFDLFFAIFLGPILPTAGLKVCRLIIVQTAFQRKNHPFLIFPCLFLLWKQLELLSFLGVPSKNSLILFPTLPSPPLACRPPLNCFACFRWLASTKIIPSKLKPKIFAIWVTFGHPPIFFKGPKKKWVTHIS